MMTGEAGFVDSAAARFGLHKHDTARQNTMSDTKYVLMHSSNVTKLAFPFFENTRTGRQIQVREKERKKAEANGGWGGKGCRARRGQ